MNQLRSMVCSRLRVLTATLLYLFLPRAAPSTSTCPTSWDPGRQPRIRREWGSRCLFVPRQRSTSLSRCVDLCKEHGGVPACIGSAEENNFVMDELAASDGLWLGLYQNETGLRPAKGWGRCVAGDAPSFTNWHQGQPDDYHGYPKSCTWVDTSTGQWRALACDGGVVFDPRPWRIAELSCLCAHGNASAAFADDRKALEATNIYNQRLLSRRTAIAFAVAAALALLPTLLLLGLLLGRRGWRRLRRGAGRPRRVASARVQDAATLPSLLKPAGTLLSIPRPSGAAISAAAAVKVVLRAARESAAGRRLRVSFVMGQAGWVLTMIGLTPTVMVAMGQSIEAAVGDRSWWTILAPPGNCLLLLAVFPIDTRAIRVVCATFVITYIEYAALFIVLTITGGLSYARGFPFVALLFAAAAALSPTLRCRGDRAMQPRPALRRLWTVSRLLFLGVGVLFVGTSISDLVQRGSASTMNHSELSSDIRVHSAFAAVSAACFLCAALATPRNRGRLHRRLGRLGGRGTEAEEAAAVAALVGGSAPAEAALERAAKLFRCLPASRLHAADLADKSTESPDHGPTLHARTEPAAMGQVTAFLSHSWSDEDEAPGAKHALVSHWASLCQEATGEEPTLWLDKACIDQNNIQQSLACLPVFLAGCQTLLVVAGPTYCSRLWCVMELFTFARMGGDQERVEIHLIAHPDDDQTEARRRLTEQFATFDAAKAQCFLASDREHLLAVIEAGFGDFDHFNRVARSLFTSRISDDISARRTMSLSCQASRRKLSNELSKIVPFRRQVT